MSFDWNLSSDEDLDEWTRREGFLREGDHDEPQSVAAVAAAIPAGFAVEIDEDEEESVNWEDVEDGDQKPSAKAEATDNLKPLMIDMDRQGDKPKRRRKRCNKIPLSMLPSDLQDFLWDLSHSHLLALTSRATFLSNIAADDDVVAVAHSLIPPLWIESISSESSKAAPRVKDVEDFLKWYGGTASFRWICVCQMMGTQPLNLDFVHPRRRVSQRRANFAAGAPRYRRSVKSTYSESSSLQGSSVSVEAIEQMASYLSTTHDDDPQLLDEAPAQTNLHRLLLLSAMLRSLGWRTRIVQSMKPISTHIDVDHPLLSSCGNLFRATQHRSSKKRKGSKSDPVSIQNKTTFPLELVPEDTVWVEVLCQVRNKNRPCRRWIHVDPNHQLVNRPDKVETGLKHPVVYVVAVEHNVWVSRFHITDVTPRYAQSFVTSLKLRGISGKKALEKHQDTWWTSTLKALNGDYSPSKNQATGFSQEEAIVLDEFNSESESPAKSVDPDADDEALELQQSVSSEAIPTSKADFKTHPVYVLPSLMAKVEVLAPDARKRICGVFKGECIYRRVDVSDALPTKKWLYRGRKVRESEMESPILRVKARKKPAKKTFQPLLTYGMGAGNDGSEARREEEIAAATSPLDEDGMQQLYAIWQTDPWSPVPVGPTDEIPVNEFKNIELELLNPGLVHIDERGVAGIAKKLGIPYAPCLIGFEGQGGNRTPTIRGIVVHAHNEQLLREASVEVSSHVQEVEEENRRRVALRRWKKLMVGLLTKERLEREYGDR